MFNLRIILSLCALTTALFIVSCTGRFNKNDLDQKSTYVLSAPQDFSKQNREFELVQPNFQFQCYASLLNSLGGKSYYVQTLSRTGSIPYSNAYYNWVMESNSTNKEIGLPTDLSLKIEWYKRNLIEKTGGDLEFTWGVSPLVEGRARNDWEVYFTDKLGSRVYIPVKQTPKSFTVYVVLHWDDLYAAVERSGAIDIVVTSRSSPNVRRYQFTRALIKSVDHSLALLEHRAFEDSKNFTRRCEAVGIGPSTALHNVGFWEWQFRSWMTESGAVAVGRLSVRETSLSVLRRSASIDDVETAIAAWISDRHTKFFDNLVTDHFADVRMEIRVDRAHDVITALL